MRGGACIAAVALCLVGDLVGCVAPSTSTSQQALTDDVRHARLTTIRDIAAQMGVHNAALLGGIATSETDLAQCHSEASSSCAGPASPDCNGGAVVAGASDGACSAMQGGLGIFQFDGGTYAQTLTAYGSGVLTVDGSSALAVSFVISKAQLDISGVTDWATAAAWIDSVPMDATSTGMKQWASLMACRYNGCCTASTTCTTRGNTYRDNALAVYGEMGSAFWATAGRCAALPSDGVIDTRTECYEAAGDPHFWRVETSDGYGGGLEWTNATDATAPANYAEWRIRPGRAGRFRVEVYVDGGAFGMSKQARYEVHHAGSEDDVVIDQTTPPAAGGGFVALGEYAFSGKPADDERVRLGDNTGEASATSTHLAFDAVRVTATDGGSGGGGGGGVDGGTGSGGGMTDMSGCAAAGGAGGALALLGAALLVGRTGRKQPRARKRRGKR